MCGKCGSSTAFCKKGLCRCLLRSGAWYCPLARTTPTPPACCAGAEHSRSSFADELQGGIGAAKLTCQRCRGQWGCGGRRAWPSGPPSWAHALSEKGSESSRKGSASSVPRKETKEPCPWAWVEEAVMHSESQYQGSTQSGTHEHNAGRQVARASQLLQTQARTGACLKVHTAHQHAMLHRCADLVGKDLCSTSDSTTGHVQGVSSPVQHSLFSHSCAGVPHKAL